MEMTQNEKCLVDVITCLNNDLKLYKEFDDANSKRIAQLNNKINELQKVLARIDTVVYKSGRSKIATDIQKLLKDVDYPNLRIFNI